MLEGFKFIGIEIDPNYIEIAEARIKHAAKEADNSTTQIELI